MRLTRIIEAPGSYDAARTRKRERRRQVASELRARRAAIEALRARLVEIQCGGEFAYAVKMPGGHWRCANCGEPVAVVT